MFLVLPLQNEVSVENNIYLLLFNEGNTFIQWQYVNLLKLVILMLRNKMFLNATQYYVVTYLT